MGFFYNKILHPVLSACIGKKAFTTNPSLCIIINADENYLIADEFFRISLNYQDGAFGLPKDWRKAKYYCKKAAELGHAPAQVMMVQWLMEKPDDASDEVMYWLKKAAEQGERQACYNYGISIHRGDVKDMDPISDSLEYFRKSAELGYHPAYSRMAYIYHTGEGVEKNDTIAKYWGWMDYAEAENENERNQSIFLELIDKSDLKDGNTIKGRAIIEAAADAGEADAMCSWGTGLLDYDKEKAMSLLKRSADSGNQIAACNIARKLWTPEVKEYDKARELFLPSAKWGCAESQYGLAVIYGEGLGVEPDMKKCWEWLEKAINLGDTDARNYLSHLCLSNRIQEILPGSNIVYRGYEYLELSKIQ